jgi:hypothetical protein
MEPDRRKDGKVDEDGQGPRSVGEDRPCRLGLRRSGHPVQHHHERLAHLPGEPARSAPPTRARNTCSSTTRPATWPRSTCCSSGPRHGKFDIAAYEHAVRLWTMVLEISVMMAQFPSKEIAELSYKYRTLGLGYANIGGLLMTTGIPYDSEEGRAICGALTAIMTGVPTPPRPRWPASSAPSPATRKRREHAARHAQPPPRRPRRGHRWLRGLSVNPVPLDHARTAPTRT